MKGMLSEALVGGSVAEKPSATCIDKPTSAAVTQGLRAGGEPLVSFVAYSPSGQMRRVFSFLSAI